MEDTLAACFLLRFSLPFSLDVLDLLCRQISSVRECSQSADSYFICACKASEHVEDNGSTQHILHCSLFLSRSKQNRMRQWCCGGSGYMPV